MVSNSPPSRSNSTAKFQAEEHFILGALGDFFSSGTYVIDADYYLRWINRSRAEQAGEGNQEFVGQLCFQSLFGLSEPCKGCLVVKTLSSGEATQRYEQRRIQEAPFELVIQTFAVRGDQDSIVGVMLLETDITEKRHLESLLIQSEKLAAVGQLAAGIAHEINNPLTAIIANAQILHRELPQESDLHESVDLISRAGARAAQVVRNLLDFARKDEYHLSVTDVNETIEEAVELVQHELLARGVAVNLDLDRDIPTILASADMLQSVWLNLLLNAIDALEKPPQKIRITSGKTKQELRVSIADNGRGIPSENLNQIFEPFFTTKAPGRGTGLGLSVSSRIIRQHGGYFLVESQLAVGSTFTVVLPIS
jgi:two-component system, NtrC family, sensor kinase